MVPPRRFDLSTLLVSISAHPVTKNKINTINGMIFMTSSFLDIRLFYLISVNLTQRPRKSKKHGNRQADGGGEVFHTGKSDREYSEWVEKMECG